MKDDAQAPQSTVSSIVDVWTSTTTGFAFTETLTTGSLDGINFNECTATGSLYNGTCPAIVSFTGLNILAGTTSSNILLSIVSSAPGGVGVSSVGSTSAGLYIQYDYTSGVPEPATLSLMGGALLGLGLFAKKLARR